MLIFFREIPELDNYLSLKDVIKSPTLCVLLAVYLLPDGELLKVYIIFCETYETY